MRCDNVVDADGNGDDDEDGKRVRDSVSDDYIQRSRVERVPKMTARQRVGCV